MTFSNISGVAGAQIMHEECRVRHRTCKPRRKRAPDQASADKADPLKNGMAHRAEREFL
jgi:hypothetical protein